jgi:hypothetical protein
MNFNLPKKLTTLISLIALFAFSAAEALSGFGLEYVEKTELVKAEPGEIIGRVVQWALGIVGVILLIMLIYGGVLYMTSAGNEQKLETAKKTITYAVVGSIIVALAFAITRFVVQALFPSGGGTQPSPSPYED